MQQVIGALLAALIFLFQWYYGLVPQDHGWLGIKSLGWPYLILIVALCLISGVRAPAIIAKENFQNSASLSLQNENLSASISKLKLQLKEATSPQRSAFIQRELESIRAKYSRYDQMTKNMLLYFVRNGKVVNQHHMGIYPMPGGFTQQTAKDALKCLQSDNIITSETHSFPGGWEETYSVAPHIARFLEEILG